MKTAWLPLLLASVAHSLVAADFNKQIRPLLSEYCLKCHSAEKHKGDLDLERFSSLGEIKRHPKVWQSVLEQVASKEMPPKDQPQLGETDRKKLLGWVAGTLEEIARANAGDPGPVVLRRLSNAEYTYTIRDLTGVQSLDPAREFPVDGAAGEGFMNVGNALVMSPSLLTKYLDAAKSVASHAVLTPDGFRFSPNTTRRDWTEELLTEIREFYRQFTDPSGGDKVNLQGIVFETNEGGRLPLERYLTALLEPRKTNGLNARYLKTLSAALSKGESSFLLDPLRGRWRQANAEAVPFLVAGITNWQKALWKFNSVGHMGRAGGPKSWLEAVTPIASKQEVRFNLAAPKEGEEIKVQLVTGAAGDGNDHDFAVWKEPRLVGRGRPDLLVRDVPEVTRNLTARRQKIFNDVPLYLAAAAEAASAPTTSDLAALSQKHHVEADALEAWLDYLGVGSGDAAKIDSLLTNVIKSASGQDFINGWGSSETPLILANSSDQNVRIPGNANARSVVMHPSQKLQIAAGWRSPLAGSVRVETRVRHAHPECGNGVTWSLELRRGATRRRLAAGAVNGPKEEEPAPVENLQVRPGDLISILIGPRDGNHSCDLTGVDLIIAGGGREWNLAADVSPNILAGNPHADRFGNESIWNFYTEPDKGGEAGVVIPPGSLLAKWESTADASEKKTLAAAVQKLLTAARPADSESPDAKLHRQLSSLGGPLFTGLIRTAIREAAGKSTGPASISVQAPSVIEVSLPSDIAAGCEFVVTGELDPQRGAEGSVQMQTLTKEAPAENDSAIASVSIVANEGSRARQRIERDMEEFRQLFPAALCYPKIVPVDEVVTLTLFHREDDHLIRLMLDEAQTARLNRLWDELHFVSQDALTLVDAYEQISQYATQDAPEMVKALAPMRASIMARADGYRQSLVAAEPRQLRAVLEFADLAYRRPLASAEREELRALYDKLRHQELPHEDALRLTLARVFVAPAFLYHAETPGPGANSSPVDDWELASRLSYFLWSSMPDAELRKVAASGKLRDPKVLAAQARRMSCDPRVRRMATEFACAWLHVYAFNELGEKSERHFPTFADLRDEMYEETIQFFTDLVRRDGSVLEIINADYTFLNETLAKHYDIPNVSGPEWRRVDGVKKYSRGGILAHATTLAKQSGASRTSPILRGNWLSEVILGEKLPRPPKDVPQLPEDEATETLTVRQLTEKHSSDPRCAGCHQRIDAFGFSLESFDAIGRQRDKDLGGRPIDARATTMDGASLEGIDGLRNYLLTKRRDAFEKQFCRKLLGYALGRGIQLSDEPLLKEMRAQLRKEKYRLSAAINMVVKSRQFREIRGRETAVDE